MPDVLIRDVPKSVLEDAKSIASAHHHTLQRELQVILEEGVCFARGRWARSASQVKEGLRLSRKTFSDSAKLLSKDRER